MSLKRIISALVLICGLCTAAPTAASTDVAADPNIPQLPFSLPSGFPTPDVASYSPVKFPVPTHFGLFGYSFDGSVWNQSYYADGQPYNKDLWGFLSRPQDAYGNQTFGSYAFGVGPHKHLFAMNDGRIATTSANSVETNWVLFESWKDWWEYKRSGEKEDPIPECSVLPFFDVLSCRVNGTQLRFAYCKKGVPEGVGYTEGTVIWGTKTDPCTPIVLHVKQVPKTYGNQFPEQACSAYQYIEKCREQKSR